MKGWERLLRSLEKLPPDISTLKKQLIGKYMRKAFYFLSVHRAKYSTPSRLRKDFVREGEGWLGGPSG